MEQAVLTELKAPGKSCSAPADFALNLTIVYEDAATREWAAEVCGRVARLVGKEAVRSTWWKLSDLNGPAVLAGAVSTALRSDVVVVAIHAAEKLSLPFYVWVDSWLPHRPARLAALVALVALPRQPSLALERAQDYLRAVAREGQLDFLLEERRLAAAAVDSKQRSPRPQRSAPTAAPSGPRGLFPKRGSYRWQSVAARSKWPAAA